MRSPRWRLRWLVGRRLTVVRGTRYCQGCMIARAEASSVPARFEWPLEALFRDLRVRYGIKMGLAGLLALFWALVLRLEHTNWSVLTVVVMMGSQHVGAIGIKVIMRVAGTIVGAVLGVWLIGSYDTAPVIVLTGIFLVVGIATYKFGQLPASQVPYGYFLVGLTLLSVATYGVPGPGQIWQTCLNRALENLVGAFSALVVTTVVWPRYAGEEFFAAGQAALETAGKLLTLETDAYVHQRKGPAGLDQIRATFTSQVTAVRNLLHVGARESTRFQSRMANYNAFVVSLQDLYQSAADLERRRPNELPILDRARDEIEALNAAIELEFAVLTRPRLGYEQLPPSQLKERLEALEARIILIRSDPEQLFLSLPLEVARAFVAHWSAIRRVCEDLDNIRDAMAGLPRHGQSLPEHKVIWDLLPTIDWFWVKNGIKGGLATVIAIILVQSYNPPGPAAIPLAAWTMTIFSRPFLRAGGFGDLGLFQRVFWASLVFVAVVVLLLLATPYLADYAAMCAALSAILFALGFCTARAAGFGFWAFLTILCVSTFVGLNPQVPVPSITIINSFLGLSTGMLISALVGRLIWPVLPQEVFRDDLLKFFQALKALLNRDRHMERIRTQLALLPAEAGQVSQQIRIRDFSEAERAKVGQLIRTSQVLVMECTALVSNSFVLPESVVAILRPEMARLETEFRQMLDTFVECFRKGDCRRPFPSLREAMSSLEKGIHKTRDTGLLSQQDLDGVRHIIEITNRYQSMADALEECSGVMQSLQLHRYTGDCAL
jgi:uncharacterized membrane protein YccC